MLPTRQKLTAAYIGFFVSLAALMGFGAFSLLPANAPQVPIDWVGRAQTCRTTIFSSLRDEKPSPRLWDEISTVCYMQARGEAILADFTIRRANLLGQLTEGRIVLWMVVAITLSGVLLAGLQLMAAYRLAGAGRGEFAASQELTLEQNKISVKSSVTGLLILIVSFAFFMVYVIYVYTSKELRQEAPESRASNPSTTAIVPNLGVGSYELPSVGGSGTSSGPSQSPKSAPDTTIPSR
jgi:hypothetical protein